MDKQLDIFRSVPAALGHGAQQITRLRIGMLDTARNMFEKLNVERETTWNKHVFGDIDMLGSRRFWGPSLEPGRQKRHMFGRTKHESTQR